MEHRTEMLQKPDDPVIEQVAQKETQSSFTVTISLAECGHHWRASGLGVRADAITPSLALEIFARNLRTDCELQEIKQRLKR